MKCRICCEP